MVTEAKPSQSLLFMRLKSYLSAETKHGNPDKCELPLFEWGGINTERGTEK